MGRRHRDNTGGMRVVGLLRGVNLGPSRKLKMADLRAVVESLGHTDVETYLQSGNVVFTPKGRSTSGLGAGISAALAEAVGMDVAVLTRTGAEMAKIVAACPYQVDDPTKLVVTFLESAADAKALKAFDASPVRPRGTHRPRHRGLPGPPERSSPLEPGRRPRQGQDTRPRRGHHEELAHRPRPGRDVPLIGFLSTSSR